MLQFLLSDYMTQEFPVPNLIDLNNLELWQICQKDSIDFVLSMKFAAYA